MVVAYKPVKSFNILFVERDERFIQHFVSMGHKTFKSLVGLYFSNIQFSSYLMEFHCPDLDNRNG